MRSPSMLNIRSVVTLAAIAALAVVLFLTLNVSAAERHGAQMNKHQTTGVQVRGAYTAVNSDDVTGAVPPDRPRYEGGAISAPAGR
jgi:hypothetical protein